MKKINLREFLDDNDMEELSNDTISKIDGGCMTILYKCIYGVHVTSSQTLRCDTWSPTKGCSNHSTRTEWVDCRP